MSVALHFAFYNSSDVTIESQMKRSSTFDPWDMGTDSYSRKHHPVWNSTFVYTCTIGMKTKTKGVPVYIHVFEKTNKFKYVANLKLIVRNRD